LRRRPPTSEPRFRVVAGALLLAVVALLVTLSTRSFAEAAPSYQVIVHPGNPVTSVDRSFLEDAFLKKIVHWPSDETIHPVDLGPGSPTRHAFSQSVLRRSVDAVKGYWQQRIFSGRDVPPPELDSDDEVVRYVLKYGGAVGYVSGTANIGGAKAVTVR
jgi:ABC-type phosphate transport system substrate-binding protein